MHFLQGKLEKSKELFILIQQENNTAVKICEWKA